MTVATGNNVNFKLKTDARKNLSSYVTKVSVNSKGHGLIDVTTAGQSGHKWGSDELEDCSFSVDFMWDKASDGPYDVLKTFSRYTTPHAFEILPEGETATYPLWCGKCHMEGDLPTEIPVGDMIKMSGVGFKVDGPMTHSVYYSGAASCAVTGTLANGCNESDIVSGGETLILTLTNAEWQNLSSLQLAQAFQVLLTGNKDGATIGFDDIKTTLLAKGTVVRTSATVVTITLAAGATYAIDADETISLADLDDTVLAAEDAITPDTVSYTVTNGA